MTDHPLPGSGAVPPHFTQQAGALFEEKAAAYVLNLSELSQKAAKRTHDEMVTKRHVEDAARFLGTTPTQNLKDILVKVFGVVGATLFGSGISQLLSMASANEYTKDGVWGSMALIVIGVLTAAYHILNN
ncbi:hypothetical protein [Nocardioides sp. NPDC047086]|uniref:hypothetical protein n=1 Tax=Nocardioides sp. NPDC047086 TaxID=3154810 RepID=UPI00340AB2CF